MWLSARWHCQLVAMETVVHDTLATVSVSMTQQNMVLQRERGGWMKWYRKKTGRLTQRWWTWQEHMFSFIPSPSQCPHIKCVLILQKYNIDGVMLCYELSWTCFSSFQNETSKPPLQGHTPSPVWQWPTMLSVNTFCLQVTAVFLLTFVAAVKGTV